MIDKFAMYNSTKEKQKEFSEYVHENFKLIHTKMISEMRRKLDITPDMSNVDGYVSLMASLQGRMFNEMVYTLCAFCQALKLNPTEMIPVNTLIMLVNLFQGSNPLQGYVRDDVTQDRAKSQQYYLENIEELRKVVEALPK